jgi:asparagine synthetase B (glutamine-hydrolysing)
MHYYQSVSIDSAQEVLGGSAMPGLAGVIGTEDARGLLEPLLFRLCHRPGYDVSLYWRPGLALARIERPAPSTPGGGMEVTELSGAADLCLVHGTAGSAPDGPAAPEWVRACLDEERPADLALLEGSFHALRAAGTRVRLVSDRFGHHPLYAARVRGGIAFAPEVQALAGLPGVDTTPDFQAVRQLLEHGHPFDQRTLLSGVELLPTGAVTEITPGGWLSKSYFHFDPPAVVPLSGAAEIGRAMEGAVSSALQRAGSGKRIGCMLSGGMDSRTIAAEAAALGAGLTAITFGTPDSPDVRLAGRVAGILGLRHLVFNLDPARVADALFESVLVTGGTTGAAHLAGHSTNREVAREVDLILSGMCGDGIMGNVPADAPSRPVKVVHGLPAHVAGLLMRGDFRTSTQGEYQSSIEVDASNYPEGTSLQLINTFEAMRCRWRRLTLSGVVSRRIDTGVLLPFFHQPLLEAAFSLPPEKRLHQAAYLESFCARHPDCAAVPWERTGRPPTRGAAPPPRPGRAARALLRRLVGLVGLGPRKQAGHFDFAAELRRQGPLRRMTLDLLTDQTAAQRPWLDSPGVCQLIEEHTDGRANNLHPLTRAMTIELFLRGSR